MSTSFLQVKNRAESTLASGIDNIVTSLTLTAGGGESFPTPGNGFHITIEAEILKCTGKTGDVLTVVRAQEGTASASHGAGVDVELRVTAKLVDDLDGVINTIENKPAFGLLSGWTTGRLKKGAGVDSTPTEVDIPIVVKSTGGDYTKLSSALNAITDATADKRYVILVFGKVSDDVQIVAKSYIDVRGYNAYVEITSDVDFAHRREAVSLYNVTNCLWQNLTFERKGTPPSTAPCGLEEGTDPTVRIMNCCFYNSLVTASHGHGFQSMGEAYMESCYGEGSPNGSPSTGIWISHGSKTTLVNCKGQGKGNGACCDGIDISGHANPILIGCEGYGSLSGQQSCYGIVIWDASTPLLESCVARGGLGSDCPAYVVAYSASPRLIGCSNKLHDSVYQWYYTAINDGRFRPYALIPYQVLSLMVWVDVAAAAGATLKVGTTIGGSQVASDIPIDATGEIQHNFNQVQVAADGYLYATPSVSIADNDISIIYSVCRNDQTTSIVKVDGSGYAVFEGCDFVAPGGLNPGCVSIQIHAVDAPNFSFNNCHIKSLAPTERCSVWAKSSLANAPFFRCMLEGSIFNVTSFKEEVPSSVTSGERALMLAGL